MRGLRSFLAIYCILAPCGAAIARPVPGTIPERPFGCVNKIIKEAIRRYFALAQDEFGLSGSFEYEVNPTSIDKHEFEVTVTFARDPTSSVKISIFLSDNETACDILP